MSLARIGYGSTFETNRGTGWQTLGELTGFSLGGISRDVIDAGHECAPSEWRDSVAGLKTGGDAAVEINFTVSEYEKLQAELDSDVFYPRRFWFTDGHVFQFNAILTGLDTAIPTGDKVSTSAKFKIGGMPAKLFRIPLFGGLYLPEVYADFINGAYLYKDEIYSDPYKWIAAMGGTFTRTMFGSPYPAVVRNKLGFFEAVANNKLRFDHDENGNALGLLIEDQRANYIPNSRTLPVGVGGPNTCVASTDIPALYPGCTVMKHTLGTLADTNVGGAIFPAVNVPNQKWVFSCWVYIPGSIGLQQIRFYQDQAAAPWAAAAGAIWTSAVMEIRDKWQKVYGMLATGATGTAGGIVVVRPTATVGDFFYTTMWQLELSAGDPTSFVANDVALNTRGADGFVPGPKTIGFGTALVETDTPSNVAETYGQHVATADSSPANQAYIYGIGLTGKAATQMRATGVQTINSAPAGSVRRICTSWTDFWGAAICMNGGPVNAVEGRSVHPALPIVIGSTKQAGNHYGAINGHIREMAYWPNVTWEFDEWLQDITKPQ